jgi:hypothetical protein
MRVITGLVGLAVLLLGTGCGRTETVKQCRADLRQLTEETSSYEAEYTTLYGPNVISQRPIKELWEREKTLETCMIADSGNREEYKSAVYRLGFIESMRFQRFALDTKQMPDFEQWEKNEQAAELASYQAEGKITSGTLRY